ncbi:ABC transporter ATP-binding protein [Gordonia sp. DT219]|uniref:ABC transporter ATP-binding protein n=1 Tax=Gordonia sp. DT219 TaxID=3416658 RepID=UPI003CFB98CC
MVFQSYALWPHKTVAENVSYPLRLRKVGKDEIAPKVHEALSMVGLEGLADRYPYQLSGGQQQRVALARAVVYSPGVLLLDEPLSNLDAKLREQARNWLKEFQSTVGLTTIFVTHDQDEALSLSDRIIVMNDGRIEQVGAPEEIYRNPANPFVASFLGSANLLPGNASGHSDTTAAVRLRGDGPTLVVDDDRQRGDVLVMVRPEDIEIGAGDADPTRFPVHGIITSRMFVGSAFRISRVQSAIDRPTSAPYASSTFGLVNRSIGLVRARRAAPALGARGLPLLTGHGQANLDAHPTS